MKKERLDKIISSQLSVSRTEAKSIIRRGQVVVNGIKQRDPSLSVIPENDEIFALGDRVEYKKYVYILMNKPSGLLSASNDKKAKTVVDIIDCKLKRPGLFPVGRLDKTTTGLLIITDDGDFAHKVLSPKNKIPKTYIAELDGDVTDEIIEQFAKGVTLADKTLCRPAVCERLEDKKVRVTITEGKYHQIKRMFGVFNLGVNSL
ncbi:MAG: rRNA pseudouridine synthase, partial [Clostridia bacterium]|nr:rRNA pseudouridine synthase [Clostridia bacterium]